MRYITYADSERYPIAILVKATSFKRQEILTNYVDFLTSAGIPIHDIISYSLKYNESNKAPASLIKEYLMELLPALDSIGVSHLFVTDAAYFKTLTRQTKAEPHFGYVLPCKIAGFEHMNVVLGLNYQQLIYNPALTPKLESSLQTLAEHYKGTYQPPGIGIIHSAQYPQGLQEVRGALQRLHQYEALTCDIEGFSLRFNEAGVGTIAFAWDEHNGIAFECDYVNETDGYQLTKALKADNLVCKRELRQFFEEYRGKLIFHHAPYDIKALIYNLWMTDLMDRKGMLKGLEILTRDMEDTKIIAYLATNSTAGNVLGLKALAHEFAGNWAVEEIKDIRRVPLPDLLQYNLVDCLSTWYVYKKYRPIMVADQQEQIYQELMLPSLKMILQMELIGMPINDDKLIEVKDQLRVQEQLCLDTIRKSPTIQIFTLLVQQSAMESANAKLKIKQHPLEKFSGVEFNPNSGPQLQRLLYELMALPVLDYTDSGQPATGAETIEKLINHTTNPGYKEILEALIGYGKVSKILGTFIPAFERGLVKDQSGIRWLHGSFNLGGTVSGRLSSSDPNLQNIPAGATGSEVKQLYGKLIKSCFSAPDGWLFCGADFNSLEDYISALTTKDPNKLAVYEKKFDGHCLRAAYYFRDEIPHIDLSDPHSVNSLKKTHPQLRQDSKGPTFALTYQGTWHTLCNNLGLPEAQAKAIETNYHELYKVSDQYVQDRLEQASKDGYVEVAFKLRVRTPLLKQVMFGSKKMPYEAAAEGRTAGNALGQSYGLLNNRAANEFMEKVWVSPYRYKVFPVALIHDAIYLLIVNDVEVVEWVNRELIKSMQWQELPEIQHPVVKLGAALDIFWPNWSNPITLPNAATQKEIWDICQSSKKQYLEKNHA